MTEAEEQRRPGPTLTYTIDAEDRLAAVDAGYLAFARQNLWAGAEAGIGRSLWDFVSGSTVQKVQRSLLRRVRRSGRPIELPFRCDAPGVRREMTIEIAPRGSAGTVVFSARVLSEAHRPVQALLDPDKLRGEGSIEMCAWCDRFLVDGEWMEVEAASRVLGLTTASELPQISHGLCDRCADTLASA